MDTRPALFAAGTRDTQRGRACLALPNSAHKRLSCPGHRARPWRVASKRTGSGKLDPARMHRMAFGVSFATAGHFDGTVSVRRLDE